MAFYEVTFSPTGGTKKVADILSNVLAQDKMQIDLCDRKTDFNAISFSKEDIVLIAVPSYGGRVPAIAVERVEKLTGNQAKAILLVVYGNRAYDNTLAELQSVVQKAGFIDVAAIAALAQHSISTQVAAGRPDEKDQAQLKEMAIQIKDKLESEEYSVLKVPGKVPEKRSSMSMGMAPKMTNACVKCGLCADQCPAGAIDETEMIVDAKKCISCMRCIAICPHEARKLNQVITTLGGVALHVLCSSRKENELFI